MFKYLSFTKIKKNTVVLLNNSRVTDFSVAVKAKVGGKIGLWLGWIATWDFRWNCSQTRFDFNCLGPYDHAMFRLRFSEGLPGEARSGECFAIHITWFEVTVIVWEGWCAQARLEGEKAFCSTSVRSWARLENVMKTVNKVGAIVVAPG